MSTNITKMIERGEDALKKKNFDYAITVLLEAVSFAPNNRRARELLRRAEMRKYEHSYPSAFARAVFGLGARTGMFFTGFGKKSNPEPYMMACEKYLRLDPKNRQVNMALGNAAASAGHVETAIASFEFVAEHYPDDVEALKTLGRLLRRSGEISKAHAAYDRVVRIAPRDQEAIKARKNLAAEASLKETGFETAGSSRDLIRDKEAAGKLEQQERIFQTEGDLSRQRSALEERLAGEPTNTDLLQDLAEICERLHDWDAAAAALAKALETKPDDLSMQFAKDDMDLRRLESEQLALVRAGKQEEAATVAQQLLVSRTAAFRKRVRAYPTALNLRFQLGDLLLKQGALDEAIGEFQQTVRDPKYRSESQLRLGKAFAAKGQHDLAVRQLRQALEGQSGLTDRVKEIRYNLGDILERKGDPEGAKEQFGMIYESDIGFRDVAERLSKLETPGKQGTLSPENPG